MEIIIRADSNKKIGTGHIVRAINLSKFFLKKKINSSILSRSSAEILKFSKTYENYFIKINKNKSIKEEKKIILNILKKAKQPVFILDVLNYVIYQDLVKELEKYRIDTVLICDHKKKVLFDAKIIINANPCQSKFKYSDSKSTYLMGHKYMIMDPSYKNIKRKKINKHINSILVSVGGTDQNDMIYQVIELIENSISNSKVNIYSSSSSKTYISKLKLYLNKNKYNNSYRLFLDVKNFYNSWWKNDIAITASGNTLFERIASGLPGVSISQFSQQFYIAQQFDIMGLNCNLNFTSGETLLNHDKFTKFISNRKIVIEQFKKLKKNKSDVGIFKIYKEILSLNKNEKF